MSEHCLYSVFDEQWRPSDALEDAFSAVEAKDAQLFKRLMDPGYEASDKDHDHLCKVLALQASRHPDVLQRGNTLNREFGKLLASVHQHPETEFLHALAKYGLSPDECANLYLVIKRVPEDQLAKELEDLLALSPQSPELPMQGAVEAWVNLKAIIEVMEMTLLDAVCPLAFVLGDTPIPQDNLGQGFTVPLSQQLAVRLAPSQTGGFSSLTRRLATEAEVDDTNNWQWNNCARIIVGPSEKLLKSV